MNEFAKSLQDKCLSLAVQMVKLAQFLTNEKREFVISRQIAKSGTSIGANVREAQFAQSDADFLSKLSIALKESSETQYWLEVLLKAEYISIELYEQLYSEVKQIVGMLVKTVKSMKSKLGIKSFNPNN